MMDIGDLAKRKKKKKRYSSRKNLLIHEIDNSTTNYVLLRITD